jgi:glutaredoxin
MRTPILIVLMLSAAAVSAQQMYKWVDDKGRTQYTDTPPPPSAKKVEEKRLRGNEISVSGDTPYSVQQAAKTFPVTLWVNNCGEICNNARNHLRKRGVPFAERDPTGEKDQEAFKKASGGSDKVPLLLVGTLRTLTGYSPGEWDSALDEAGYPRNAPAIKPPAKGPATPAPAPEAAAPAPASTGK